MLLFCFNGKEDAAMGLLDGKKALITGVATRKSIAWGIAQAFHEQGAQLAFTCVQGAVPRLQKLAPLVGSDLIIPCDVQKDGEIQSAVAQAAGAFGGKLDILVHSIAYANIDDMGGEFIKVSRAGWSLALEISAYSLVAMARAARPFMKAAGGGSILALTFGGGDKVAPKYNIMGIAKAALESAMRYLAYDLGPENIRVNAVSPGPLPTLSSMVIEGFDTAVHLGETHSPMLRNATMEEVGKTAVYLASNLSSAITGLVHKVDCGMSSVASPSIPRIDDKPVNP